jgi:hypothetical protein
VKFKPAVTRELEKSGSFTFPVLMISPPYVVNLAYYYRIIHFLDNFNFYYYHYIPYFIHVFRYFINVGLNYQINKV